MPVHGVLAKGVVYGVVAGDVTSAAGGNDYVSLGIGSATAIVLALIGLQAARKKDRHGDDPEDVNAITVARTVEANLATYKAENSARVGALEQRTGAIEDHVRPWPKERR